MTSLQQINNNKLHFRLLLLSNSLFIVLYFILLYFNRYSSDDHFFVYDAKTRGVIGAALFTAQTWTPRPAEMLLYNTLTRYLPEQIVLIGYGFSVMFLLIAALYRLIILLIKKTATQLPEYSLQYAVLLCCSFFFSSFSIGETWFWLCSSAGYLLSLVAFLWGIIFILNKKNNFTIYLLLLLCFGYITGAAETFAATTIFICWVTLFIYIYIYRSSLNKLQEQSTFKKLLFVSSLSSIALLMIYFGQGTQFRKSLLTQSGFFGTLYVSAKTMAWVLVKRIPFQIPYLLLFSVPFIELGKQLSRNTFAFTIFTKKNLFLICITFLFLIYISLIPASYVMSDRGPDRSLTVIAFLLALLFAYMFTFFGYKKHNRIGNSVTSATLILSSGMLIYTTINQYSIAEHYSSEVDKRIELVLKENEKGRTEPMELKPLPSSGYYYSTELSADTAFYKNTFFKQRYALNFSCYVK
ncbi:MAG: hypothetical protein HYU69_08840 [Bacteroidetes bacterium]|nr:hypothetical protein [Bacteroidota bacterium]